MTSIQYPEDDDQALADAQREVDRLREVERIRRENADRERES